MQALLLAGGLGQRLRSVVNDRPKPMALVEGQPFLQYVIEELKKYEIKDIIMAVGYKGTMIEDYFQDGKNIGVNIQYSYEEVQLGTAGAIKNAKEFILEDNIWVLNADTYYKINYHDVYEIHKRKQADLTLALRKVVDTSRYGQVRLENNLLLSFNEKEQNEKEGIINGGIYLIKSSFLDSIPEGVVSLENNIIPRALKQGKIIAGVECNDYFIDIGIPEDYFKFIEDVRGELI